MNLSARKILLVDDVRFTRMTIAAMVRQFGEPIIFEASDGREALALLHGEAAGTDCVITDMNMPNLDGIGLLKAIREGTGGVAPTTKVILLTGHSDFDRVGPALFLDLDGFLSKPVSKKAVEACLQRLFESGSGTSTSTQMGANSAVAEAAKPLEKASGAPESPQGERAVAIWDIPSDAELTRDLMFQNGRLLLRAGSRLNSRVNDRLRELVAMSSLPEVVWIRAA